MKRMRIHTGRRRGAAIISTLFFLLVISMLLMGVGTYTVSHKQREMMDSNYASAVDTAEAGVNYELRKITQNPSNADLTQGTYSVGSGKATVWCTQDAAGTTPWNPGTQGMYVWSTGLVNGVQRTVEVSAKGYPFSGKFALYTENGVTVINGSAPLVNGDIGTNGQFKFSGTPTINGTVYFGGPSAGWYGGVAPGPYTVAYGPKQVQYPTVDQIALQLFPNSGATSPGGLSYLSTHNDNAKANPPISGSSISSSVTLVGPGNYYVTSISLSGQQVISFDNTNGPVNLWIGPSGGNGTCTFQGGSAAVPVTTNPANRCNIYCALESGITLAGNGEIDGLVYCYNKDPNGSLFGTVTVSGNPVVKGQVVCDQATLNGNIAIDYMYNYIQPTNFDYYGYSNSWQEIGGLP